MECMECIRTRRSIRRFKSEPVPKETLLSIVEAARWSPSYKNSQPWEAVIVSGRKKDALSGLLVGLLESGITPAPDMPKPDVWPPEIEKRMKEHLMKRASKLGLDLGAPDSLKKQKTANFRFYGAPHAIFLYQDSSLSEWSILDIGAFSQSIMLAANSLGLGTVPQAYPAEYAKEVKGFLDIPASKRLILGISIGYADLEARANSYRSERVGVDEIVRWVE